MKRKFLCFALLAVAAAPFTIKAQDMNLLIGTYTNSGKSEGIYVYTFNEETGDAILKNKVAVANPSYLALSQDKKYVYAVNEVGQGKGAVSAFQYDRKSGNLTLLNTEATGGDGPCHVIVDRANTHVIASNYSAGSLTVFGTKPDGSLTEREQLIEHHGNGPDKQRQEKPHVHSSTFSPDERYVLVQDLGTDEISAYPYQANGQTAVNEQGVKAFKASPGSGPRHITFSSNGKFVYLIQEMTGTVTVFGYKAGMLEKVQEISMLQSGFNGESGAADIHLSPDGKFLYASNRGDANDIAIYKVDNNTGKLTHISNQSVLGKGPRNFTLTPSGKYLLVSNQDTDEVVIFKRDASTGLLQDTQKRISVGLPVCLVLD